MKMAVLKVKELVFDPYCLVPIINETVAEKGD